MLRKYWGKWRLELASFAEFYATQDNVYTLVKHHFDKAKALSDFIGMFVRLAFASFAIAYFFKRQTEVQSFSAKWAFGLCAFLCLGIAVRFGYHIVVMIMAFELRSVHAWRSTWARLCAIAFGLLSAACVAFGIVDLIKVLSATVGPR